jgi:YHS domain-containing protein
MARACHWCEEAHPEYLRLSRDGGRLYFCSDGCYREWLTSTGPAFR